MLHPFGGRSPFASKRHAALSVSAASALLVAAPLLTACGNDAHPGAAAVVGGQRITVSQLQAKVRDVRDAQRSSPQAAQLTAASGRLSQDTLIRMIQFRVIAQAGKDNGVTVSPRDVQQARKAGEKQPGGAAAVRGLYLEQGIAPSQIDESIRMELMRAQLANKLGTGRANEVLAQTSKSLRIDINPRFGKWDNDQGKSVLVNEPWLHLPEESQQQA